MISKLLKPFREAFVAVSLHPRDKVEPGFIDLFTSSNQRLVMCVRSFHLERLFHCTCKFQLTAAKKTLAHEIEAICASQSKMLKSPGITIDTRGTGPQNPRE